MAEPQKQRYIAQGFLEDASLLLNEFINLNTVEFKDFAALWRKHHFSLIFMGRPDHTETCEFVNEIFRIASQFIFSPSFHQKVGAVYILYGLFQNQISEPSIKIRIEMEHWKVINSLRKDAISKNLKTLQYVIDFLVDNGFMYVANQTLKGPLIGNIPKASKYDESICNMRTNYRSDIMKYSACNNLTTLRDLQLEYYTEKKNIGSSKVSLIDNHKFYEEALKELQELVEPPSYKKVEPGVGIRRAKIKAESFVRKSRARIDIVSDDEVQIEDEVDPDYETPEKKKLTRRIKRVPKEERKVGRPSLKPKQEPSSEKKSDDESCDITHLLSQQTDFYLPPLKNESKKMRTKRDPYYQTSPRRETSDSDSSE